MVDETQKALVLGAAPRLLRAHPRGRGRAGRDRVVDVVGAGDDAMKPLAAVGKRAVVTAAQMRLPLDAEKRLEIGRRQKNPAGYRTIAKKPCSNNEQAGVGNK